jgi:hypothetical protein
MKKPTLDEFIGSYTPDHSKSAWVREPGFTGLYVRIGRRWAEGAWHTPCLDLSNAQARWPGRGAMTGLVKRLNRDYPDLALFAENVSLPRQWAHLKRMGFVKVTRPEYWSPCFLLAARELIPGGAWPHFPDPQWSVNH